MAESIPAYRAHLTHFRDSREQRLLVRNLRLRTLALLHDEGISPRSNLFWYEMMRIC